MICDRIRIRREWSNTWSLDYK